jgi:hypothetical protein
MSDVVGGTSMLDGQPKPPIDPRFARRWVDARREEGRRRLRILVIIAASIGLVAAGAGSLFTPVAKVRHVRVEVVGSTSVANVVADAGLAHETLMIHADPSSIEHRLDGFASLGAARVKRAWPATIEITVATRYRLAEVFVASGPHAGEWAAVDPTGRVLSDSGGVPVGTPVIYGVAGVPGPGMWLTGSPGGSAPLSGGTVDMVAASDSPNVPSGISLVLAALGGLAPSVRSEVISAAIAPSGEVSLNVLPSSIAAGSIPVHLGDGSELSAKLAALASMLTSANLSGVDAIDLSVPDRPTALTAP